MKQLSDLSKTWWGLKICLYWAGHHLKIFVTSEGRKKLEILMIEYGWIKIITRLKPYPISLSYHKHIISIWRWWS